MAQVLIVKDNRRHTKRKMHDALGNDLIKIFTELITNSDDSYRRLSKVQTAEERNHPKPIYINIFKGKKKVEVIDNAEGMSENNIIQNFESYGADKSGRAIGHKTRGLFGQGASDVLFTQIESTIVSVKNGNVVCAKFYWEGDERKIEIIDNVSINAARDLGISKDGTVVSFVLNEKTKIPNNLQDKLSQFYMLRFIMNDKDRAVYLRQYNEKSLNKEIRLHYDFPPVNEGDDLLNKEITFQIENNNIKGTLIINKILKKTDKEKQYGELKVLVYDEENNVYDNSFFNLGDRYPGVEYLFGYLTLYKTAYIIREKLNLEMPEAILTDTRDGFNRKHDFYKCLNEKIEPIFENEANKINKGGKESLKSDDFKEHKKMFKELNKFLNEELDEIQDTGSSLGAKPPVDGFDFIRDRIKMTSGKKYSLRFLVNPAIIASGTEIVFDYDGDNILINQKSITVDYDKDVGDIIFYNLVVDAISITQKDICLSAKVNNVNIEKKIFISVVNEEIYFPKYGIEFHPNHLSTIINHEAKLHLYIDTDKYPVGSKIKLSKTNSKVDLITKEIILEKKDSLFENISRKEVIFKSSYQNIIGRVIANCENFITEATVETVDSTAKEQGKSGLISGWDFAKNPEAPWQKYLHPKTGRIIINSGNKINKFYFGDDINQSKINSNKICQKYLAELISDEVAKFMVKKQIEKGQLGKEYEEAIEEHQNRKNKIADIVYKFIVI